MQDAYNKIKSLLIMLHARGLGRTTALQLIEAYGSAENAVLQGWDPQQRLFFDKWKVADWEIDWEIAEKEKVTLLTYDQELYPKNLLKSPGFPLILYVKGTLLPSDHQSLALVGTRNATLYGKQAAETLAKEIAPCGITIVSGLARGIDTAAHEGTLKGSGRTFAVLGSGLSTIYPSENRALSSKIVDSGALISEFPMKTAPSPGLFPQRNKTISGLSLGVCLVESPLEGGGMITMRVAEQQNKTLFALPGRIDWPTFEGNHLLLKQNKARLITCSSDLLNFFNRSPMKNLTQHSQPGLTEEEIALLAKFTQQEKSVEELVLLTQLPIMQLNVLLTRLVLKKVVKEFPGKIYKKIW